MKLQSMFMSTVRCCRKPSQVESSAKKGGTSAQEENAQANRSAHNVNKTSQRGQRKNFGSFCCVNAWCTRLLKLRRVADGVACELWALCVIHNPEWTPCWAPPVDKKQVTGDELRKLQKEGHPESAVLEPQARTGQGAAGLRSYRRKAPTNGAGLAGEPKSWSGQREVLRHQRTQRVSDHRPLMAWLRTGQRNRGAGPSDRR